MDTVYVSEAEAIRDIASLLKRVREGEEIVIDLGEHDAVRLILDSPNTEEEDPEFEAYCDAKIQTAMDDPRPPIPSEVVEAYFAERRKAAMSKLMGMAG